MYIHPYWTVETIGRLRKVLEEMATETDGQWVIPCPGSLKTLVWPKYKNGTIDREQIANGLTALGKLGVLDEGKRGSKKADAVRYFFPGVQITQNELDRLRER